MKNIFKKTKKKKNRRPRERPAIQNFSIILINFDRGTKLFEYFEKS